MSGVGIGMGIDITNWEINSFVCWKVQISYSPPDPAAGSQAESIGGFMDKKSTNNFLFYDLRKYFCKIEINFRRLGKSLNLR